MMAFRRRLFVLMFERLSMTWHHRSAGARQEPWFRGGGGDGTSMHMIPHEIWCFIPLTRDVRTKRRM